MSVRALSLISISIASLLTVSACSHRVDGVADDASANSAINKLTSKPSRASILSAEPNPSLWPKRETSPAKNRSIEARAATILAKMSVPEKVGQMMQPELKYITPAEVKQYHIGSVLNGGGTSPNNNKFATVQDWANLAEAFYQASMDETDGKIAIPIIWGSDAVHGNNNVYGMTLFPHNIGLGAAGDPELLHRIGKATAMEVAVTGVDWTFGPTVAVVRDIRWGRTYESYSEDPKIVMDYAREMVRGIQGDDVEPGVYKSNHVVATAKRDLNAGESLDGEGGSTVWGKLMPASDSLSRGALPIGLADVPLSRDVAIGEVVRWTDVKIDDTTGAAAIRREMEAK